MGSMEVGALGVHVQSHVLEEQKPEVEVVITPPLNMAGNRALALQVIQQAATPITAQVTTTRKP